MRSQMFLYLCALLGLLYTTCNGDSPKAISVPDYHKDQTSNQNIINVESTIDKEVSSSWKVDATKVKGREGLDSLYFLNETHGWVAGGGILYETTDGKSWGQVKINVPENANVADIFFVNPSLGWVALQKRASDVSSYQDNRLWLMQTTDGGINWRLQHEEKDAVLTHFSFMEQEGWLTGVKYTGLSPLRSNLLILHTTDQGQHWADVSEDLNRIATNEKGFVNGWITGIIPEGHLRAIVLSSVGQIFKTFDGGKSWQQVNFIRDDPTQICICHLGVKDNKHLWVAGGIDGVEGIGSMLATEQNDNSWKRYRLGGVNFADVLFLSEQQVIASGSMLANIDGDQYSNRREGLILSSSDGGQKWSIVYSNARVKRINALAAVNSKQVWAVGEDGLILRLSYALQK